jgi:hypothetical protein
MASNFFYPFPKFLEKIEFLAEMKDDEGGDIRYERELKIYYPSDYRQIINPQSGRKIISIYPNPYYWLFTTIGSTHYAFKTFENESMTIQGESSFSEFPDESIIMVIKTESIEIPDDSILFSEDWDF